MLQNKGLDALQIIWIQRLENKLSVWCFDWGFDVFIDFLTVAGKDVDERRHLRPFKLQDAFALLKFNQPLSPFILTKTGDISLQGNSIRRELLCKPIYFAP